MVVQKVAFATFMLKGEAEHIGGGPPRTHCPSMRSPLTWKVFLEVFHNSSFLDSVRDEKCSS